jgi:carbon-monoxide dehydrogenase medium subunit
MKPAPFTYHDPHSMSEVLDLMSTLENTKLLAGGQSLMPMMNFRFLMPDHLIDLNRVKELNFIKLSGEKLSIGAMTRQREIEFSKDIAVHCPVLTQALSFVGHRQTRNRGTLGGSLCHFDPSAELVNVAALLNAKLEIQSKSAQRVIDMDDFGLGYLTTQVEEGELLSQVSFDLPSPKHGYAFDEFARRHGDYAIVACSALILLNDSGRIAQACFAISGMTHRPLRLKQLEDSLIGQMPSNSVLKAFAASVSHLDAMEDSYVTATYRKHLAKIMSYRVLKAACNSAQEKING